MRTLIMLSLCLAAAPAWSQPLRVAATFSILGDMVRQVGGEHVTVATLVGAGGDVHTFEPSPADHAALADAKVIFEVGLGFEPWLNKMAAASQSKALRVATTEGIEPIEIQVGEQREADPHVWQDVTNAMVMVEHIREGLCAADPDHQDYYTRRADLYLAQLGELNLWIIDTLAHIPEERRKLVTSHPSFGYFAKRYGFKVVATASLSPSPEAEPSAAHMARFSKLLHDEHIPAVFMEANNSARHMEAVAQDAGIPAAPSLYSDTLGLSGSEGDSYINMMRHNAATVASALSPIRK